jgi:hypothetical protein
MRSCIAVHDAEDDQILAFITAREIFSRLETVSEAMFRIAKDPAGAGSSASPYIIDSFQKIVGYIHKRNEKKTSVMWFRFFGIDMYQNGNDTGEEQNAYYIGLKDGATLSYPDMRKAIEATAAEQGIKSDEVKAATGIAATNRYEMLAIACLFLAEGRRDRVSLVTHLILADLIADEVKYGSGGQKVRTLRTAIDKTKKADHYTGKYEGVTAAGDSPMSQKGAVDHGGEAWREYGFGRDAAKNRYLDKTISLVAQWFAQYYDSPNYWLEACRPADVARLSLIGAKPANYIDTQINGLTFKKGTKAGKKRQEEARLRNRLEPQLHGLKDQVLAELSAMIQVKIERAAAGQGGSASFVSDKTADTKLLKTVLAAA